MLLPTLTSLKHKIRHWEHPAASDAELILDRRRIYILPDKAGTLFLLILLSIFVTSINYGINLGYALNFILISCGWLGILYTFRNLTGTGLESCASPTVFAGELAHFSLRINNYSNHPRYAIEIGFERSSMQLLDVPPNSSHKLTLATKSHHRGWLSAPEIKVQTCFPSGLLTAWAYWQTTQQILVYPAPEIDPPPLPFTPEDAYGTHSVDLIAGNEELSGVRQYQPGDSFKQLAWRQIARQSGGDNQQLISKHFERGQRHSCVLDFANLPPYLSVEEKLSRLCAWLLAAEEEHVSYAFNLGTLRIPQNSGEDHQRTCLTALALYGN